MRPASNGARFAGVPITAPGTSAAEWLPWQRQLPALSLDRCPGVLVVAAHPDDETLGFGGAAAALAARGVEVQTVVASDGGAAWPGLSVRDQADLEHTRRHESQCASTVLGVDSPSFLGLPDGALADHESQVAEALSDLLSRCPAGTWCAATWRGDGHPDHEAVGRAAAVAASRTGAVLLEYPVWMWHWARPGDRDVPWPRAARVVCDPAAAERKRRAVDVFDSQISPGGGREPILPGHILARLQSVGEVVFR